MADLYRWWYRRRGIPSNRLLVSSFALIEPYLALRTGSVPYWMKFNMEPPLERLDDYLNQSDAYDEVHLMLFQHGVNAVGLPSAEEWRRVIGKARRQSTTLGLDLNEYPLDFPHYAKYDEAIRETIPARYPMSAPLSLAEVKE